MLSEQQIQIQVHGDPGKQTLIYLPGMHGDCTLVSSFRAALKGRVRFVEITYARTANWDLGQYAGAVLATLREKQIHDGWILGESFSSQVAWAMLSRAGKDQFQATGLILAGGFVRHPVMTMVYLAHCLNRLMPMWVLKLLCQIYARYAKLRHRQAPETLACIADFVKNRTSEPDRQAICHRYSLISKNDLRSIARNTVLPVYQICGFFDPIVPWPFVQPWLKRNCPGFRGWKVIWRADHNVLGTAPQAAAECILRWMKSTHDVVLP